MRAEGMVILPNQDKFFSPMSSITRHDVWNKRGLYEVVALTPTVKLLDFFCKERNGWVHMLACVDDFGDLVKVGEWI